MPSFRRIQEANRDYAEHFTDPHLAPQPSKHLVVLTCMDARIDLFAAAGLHVGDAHILRNAGGRVTDDVLRSMALSAWFLDTREFVVIHHTDCGLSGRSNDEIRNVMRERTGAETWDIDFLPFTDLAESVRADVARLRASPLLPEGASIWGAVFDLHDGTLTGVDRDA